MYCTSVSYKYGKVTSLSSFTYGRGNRAGSGHHMTGAPILHLGGEVVCEPFVLSRIWWHDEQLLSISPLTVRLDTTCVWSYFALVTRAT